VEDVYYDRLEMKRQGNALERVLKLEINSLYGKFAQRAGWFQPGDRIPSYHQLEWAGHITSATRAKLFRAYSQRPNNVFSFETDALFTTSQLDLPIGDKLGEWTEIVYRDILYIQSGFYFAHGIDGKLTEKYRGFDKGSIKFDEVIGWLDKLDPTNPFSRTGPKLFGPSKRFVGLKRAIQTRRKDYWRSWETTTREISIGNDGKRRHQPGCPGCRRGIKWSEGMHYLADATNGGISHPHKIPWEEEQWIENQWALEKQIDSMDGFDV
jgi:hypothetical protein